MAFSILPTFIKKPVSNFIRSRYHKKWETNFIESWKNHFFHARAEEEKNIPKYDLEQKHIANLSVLVNRKELLAKMPANAICAELGVDEGEFSKLILEIAQPKKLHLIDAWGDESRYHDGLKFMVQQKFEHEIEAGIVETNIGFSTDVLKKFPDEYFDWVYLDTAHSYGITADELNLLKAVPRPEPPII